jgi:nitrate reductase NapAB chaperone NapD
LKRKAYVLIKVMAGKLDHIMRSLSLMPEVASVEGVSGACDVVAVVRGPDLETLQETILSTIRGIDGVESTDTWIVMVPQPEEWTEKELDDFVDQCNGTELALIEVLLEHGRPMLIPEMVDDVADRVGDENFDVHGLTIALTGLTNRATKEFRREEVVDFDQDLGYFLNEKYPELIKKSLSRLLR